MAPEQVVADDGFVPASSTSIAWYKNLKCDGSCLRLYDQLAERRELVHELGPDAITALHKGVQHGCVKLVRFILVDMFDGDGKCTCKRCGAENACVLTREGLLRKVCEYGSTAVNMAVVSGSPKMVLLLKWAIDESERCKKRGLTEEDSSRKDEEILLSKFTDLRSRFLRESGEEKATESTNDAEIHLEVPDVKDDAIGENIYGADRSKKILEVYELIEEKLNKDWGDDQELMTVLKGMCEENMDFDFVPVAHIFLHFLFWMECEIGLDDSFNGFRKEILNDIIVACKERDDEEGNIGSMLVTLFNILDPQGRTILHAALWNFKSTSAIRNVLRGIEEAACATEQCPSALTRIRECVNAKDGAGRTILHLSCIRYCETLRENQWLRGKLDWDVTLSPLCFEELEALKLWCFPKYLGTPHNGSDCNPIHLAIVFDCTMVLEFMPAFEGVDSCLNAAYDDNFEMRLSNAPYDDHFEMRVRLPFQIAAFLGRVTFMDQFLQKHTKSKCINDIGLQTYDRRFGRFLPAIHCAALSGQVETIQTILKYHVYDPICQDYLEGTALHLLLNMRDWRKELERFKIFALLHALPYFEGYIGVEHDFHKLDVVETKARMFTEDEVSCINLLLQAGIDLWTLVLHVISQNILLLDLRQTMRLGNGGMTK